MNSLTTCDYYMRALGETSEHYRASTITSLYHYLNNFNIEAKGALTSYAKHMMHHNMSRISRLINNQNVSLPPNSKQATDLLLHYQNPSQNYLGIQQYVAIAGKKIGLTSTLLTNTTIQAEVNYFDQTISSHHAPSRVDKKTFSEIQNECRIFLENLRLSDFPKKLGRFDLAILQQTATTIESNMQNKMKMLDDINPRLVILLNPKNPDETALQLACKAQGIPTLFIPHGFPQKSIFPIETDQTTMFCHHNKDYFREIAPNSQLVPLGWLEPSTFQKERKPKHTNDEKKQTVLFLSQIGGHKIQRCPSLTNLVPKVLDFLEKSPSVDKILFRLRPYEIANTDVKQIFSEKRFNKIEIVTHEPINTSLDRSDTIISFSSTGLMYGPYLNKKAIEIRDAAINATWGGSVLPETHVYSHEGNWDEKQFEAFFENAPPLLGCNIFCNYQKELDAETFEILKLH